MSLSFSNNNNSTIIANSFNSTASDDESKILAWLSPLEPWVRHRDIGTQRVDSIGRWLLETEEFRLWRNGSREGESNHATLFCGGNPGVGKSYIISLVIDSLCDGAVNEGTAVTCFYFDYAARNEQTPINMLGSLLRQLVTGLGGVPRAVFESFQNERKVIGGRGLQVSGILEMFHTITSTKRTFICVDALDECMPEHRMEVLGSLGQILQRSPDTRIFITGRPYVRSEVESKLDSTAAFISIQPTEEGFIRYLREKLRNDTDPDTMSAALEADIMKSIPEISSETFLLASLHIEAILRETTIARRGKRLKSLKDGVGLGDAYGATLERIRSQDGEKVKLAMATLTWICHAERPLKVDELCHALAVEIGAADFDPDNAPSMGALIGCCQGLIIADKEAPTVRLIHITVQEYLCTHPDLFDKPHLAITEACLTYLNSKQVKDLPPHHLPDHQSMPFLEYSSRYWGIHANSGLSVHAKILALELLSQYEDHVSAVSFLRQILHHSLTPLIGNPPLFSGLHCASFFGSVELVKALMSENCDKINQKDCAGRTPLSWAARKGHEGVVNILLEMETLDPNHPDVFGETPLGWAAIEGHGGVVKLLLDREDLDPNHPDKNEQTPLGCAAVKGHEEVVRLLLTRENVDSNHPDRNDRTPLGCAAVEGHEEVAKLLLERENVDPNLPDKNDRTPLGCAALMGYEGVVKLLLQREDVDPNRPDEDDRTPLGCAAVEGHYGVVRLLLEREDIDPNLLDVNNRSPLGCSAVKGHERVVGLLLQHEGVDPNFLDENDRTPLGCAAIMGHEGVVKLLLGRQDVNADRPDNQESTSLSWAANNGHEGIVKRLLNRGDVDPNRPDENGRTSLGCAAVNGHEGVVKLLLERDDVDLNRPDVDGRTLLGCAALKGHEGAVKLLLERDDVDLNRPDVDGRTPLGCAAFEGHEGVVKLLLERGDVDLNRPDVGGRTPLGCAAVEGHEQVVKLFLGREDIDLNLPDVDDRTPLWCAALAGHEGAVKLLLEREDVDLNRPDRGGWTPLGCAAFKGHEAVVKLLLEQAGIDPNRRSKDGRTPLECATVEGHAGVVKLLYA